MDFDENANRDPSAKGLCVLVQEDRQSEEGHMAQLSSSADLSDVF